MDGYAGSLTHGHQARHHMFRITMGTADDFTVEIAGHAAHVVVHGGQHWDRVAAHIDAGEYPRRFGNARQALMNHLRSQVLQVQGGCDPQARQRHGLRGSPWSWRD